MSRVSAETCRRAFRAAEAIHGMIYFTPFGPPCYAEVGITSGRMGYFASRAAAMGPVPADVVIATFFNFNPEVVRRAIPDAWAIATPAALLGARLKAVDQSLRQAWGEGLGSPEVREAASLARAAAERATERPQGRALFAGHARLEWPEEPHLVLWHAQTLLREYRGDGHVALLLTEGLTGIEALVVHAATGDIPAEVLRRTRSWSEADWEAAVESVRARGWLEPGPELVLNAAGRAHRSSVEARTDDLSAFAYEALGEEGSQRLDELARPLSRAVVAAGLLPDRRPPK